MCCSNWPLAGVLKNARLLSCDEYMKLILMCVSALQKSF